MEDIFTVNEQQVLHLFFFYPTQLFSARGIAKHLNITHPTVLTILQRLNKKGLIKKGVVITKGTPVAHLFWQANRETEKYKLLKKWYNIQSLYNTKLIEAIAAKTAPNAVVLFGSYNKGEDTEKSDIDIFVVSKEISFKLQEYERKLKRKINITFEPRITQLNKEFLNNLINGTVLYGYLEVFK